MNDNWFSDFCFVLFDRHVHIEFSSAKKRSILKVQR